MKKRKVLAVLVALLLVVGAGVYTYARYTYSKTGNGSVNVATWAVALKQGGNSVSDNYTLELTLSNNNYVVDGKIAPNRSATATLVLDLTGTEVATDYEVYLSDVAGLPDGMSITGVTADGVALNETSTGSGVYTGSVALNTEKDAIADSEVELVITVEWENDEDNNDDDTTFGEAAGSLSIPVTVTAKQHIGD